MDSGNQRRLRNWQLLLTLLLTNLCWGQDTHTISGTLTVGVQGFGPSASTPVVVFLESVQGLHYPIETETEIITQNGATFEPNFLPVALGQVVNMPNNDTILHNVFSYTPGNVFDLGLYPQGESRQAIFKNPGLVRIYCSIHQSMQASIFVSPTPFWSLVADNGQWQIEGIPAGEYEVVTFSEWLPESRQSINLIKDTMLELVL